MGTRNTPKKKINGRIRDVVVLACMITMLELVMCAAERIGYFDMLRGMGTAGKAAGIILLIVIYAAAMAGILAAAIAGGNRKERLFLKEYSSAMRDYRETGDAARFYSSLTSMKNPPVTQTQKDAVLMSMLTALFEQGKKKEALDILSSVDDSGPAGDAAREQARKIKGEKM